MLFGFILIEDEVSRENNCFSWCCYNGSGSFSVVLLESDRGAVGFGKSMQNTLINYTEDRGSTRRHQVHQLFVWAIIFQN